MTERHHIATRDEVLFAFHQQCARPSADEILLWVGRYPQFANDIRELAAVSLEWDEGDDQEVDQPTESELNKAFSNALNALYSGQNKSLQSMPAKASQTLSDLFKARQLKIPAIARELDGIGIGRSVLADLLNGGIIGPLGARLKNALCRLLAISEAAFESALEATLASPQIGHAKASTNPTVVRRTYADVIQSSNMTSVQIAYWLDQD